MNFEVVDITQDNDKFWLALRHTNYNSVKQAYLSWEIPFGKDELESRLDYLPKDIKIKALELLGSKDK